MPFSQSGSGTGSGLEFGYDQITANVSVVSTTEATGTTIITCGAHTFDGSAVLATFFAPCLVPPTSINMVICLFEGATEIGRLCTVQSSTAPTGPPGIGMIRFTPTAASHTYTVTGFLTGAGSGTVVCGAGGTAVNSPAFIRFTKV